MKKYDQYRTIINNMVKAYYNGKNKSTNSIIPYIPIDKCTIADNYLSCKYVIQGAYEDFNEELTYQKNDFYVYFKHDENIVSNDSFYGIESDTTNTYRLAFVDGFLICGVNSYGSWSKTRSDGASCGDSDNSELLIMSFVGYDYDFDNPTLSVNNIIDENDFGDYSDVIKKYYALFEPLYVRQYNYA